MILIAENCSIFIMIAVICILSLSLSLSLACSFTRLIVSNRVASECSALLCTIGPMCMKMLLPDEGCLVSTVVQVNARAGGRTNSGALVNCRRNCRSRPTLQPLSPKVGKGDRKYDRGVCRRGESACARDQNQRALCRLG